MIQEEDILEESIFEQNYQVLGQIGSGADGNIYKVFHLSTGQIRAAKEFKQGARGSRFRELQTLRRLRHPALPQVFDILEDDSRSWLIMEYVEGWNLKDYRSRIRSAEQFFSIMEQLVEVMIYLHTQNPPILHLDIKPSNLLIDRSGHLFMIDFGASVRQIQGNWINPCVGTPGFAAPEQMNRRRMIDERTDLYGCGAVMYWCLCGHAPAENGKKSLQMPRWGLAAAMWKREVFSIIRRCMHIRRSERYANGRALLKAIRRARLHWQIRKQWWRITGALALFAMVAWFAVWSLFTEMQGRKKTERQLYEQQLEMAGGLGLEQAVSFYEQAAQLCPEDFSWCQSLIERVIADYQFDRTEEQILKRLLYSAVEGEDATQIERLKQANDLYGWFAYQMGIAYWYYYEETGGKRAAAYWFEQARETGPEQAGWYRTACLHARIGSYYEQLDQVNESGEIRTEYTVYWKDLSELWQLDYFQEESEAIRTWTAGELLGGMLLHASELKDAFVTYEQAYAVLQKIREFAQNAEVMELQEQWKEADKALRRAYGVSGEMEEEKRAG